MLFFLIFSMPFIISESGNNVSIAYSKDGKLYDHRGLKIFYQVATPDTTYSDFKNLQRKRVKLSVPSNTNYFRFLIEDKDGDQDLSRGDRPYVYIFKREGSYLALARHLLSSRVRDIEQAKEYINKEEENYPENKWTIFFKWWIYYIEGKTDKITLTLPKNPNRNEVNYALKAGFKIFQGIDPSDDIAQLLTINPNSYYIDDLTINLSGLTLESVINKLKANNIKTKYLPLLEINYLFQNYDYRTDAWTKKAKEIVNTYKSFSNRSLMLYYIARKLKPEEGEKYYKEIIKVYKDPSVFNEYGYSLISSGTNIKGGINICSKGIKLIKSGYFDRKYWLYPKKKRTDITNEYLAYLYDTIALGYHKLNKNKAALKYQTLALGRLPKGEEDPEFYSLLGDIYISLRDTTAALSTYLDGLYYNKNPGLLKKAKSLFKDNDFEAYYKKEMEKRRKGNKLNIPAPDFTLRTLYGKEMKLSSFRGKVIELNFWATWCAPCKIEIPHLNKLVEHFKDNKKVVCIAVSNEPPDRIKAFLKKQPYNFLQTTANVLNLYGVSGIPTHFIIDKRGNVQYKHVGYIPGLPEKLQEEIEDQLKEN